MQSTIAKIRRLVQEASNLSASQKTELLRYVKNLDHELTSLAKEQKEQASTIAHYTHQKAEEALGEGMSGERDEAVHSGFDEAVEQFKLTHPKLYKTLQTLSISLSGLGV